MISHAEVIVMNFFRFAAEILSASSLGCHFKATVKRVIVDRLNHRAGFAQVKLRVLQIGSYSAEIFADLVDGRQATQDSAAADHRQEATARPPMTYKVALKLK